MAEPASLEVETTEPIALKDLKSSGPRISLQQAVRDGKQSELDAWLNLPARRKNADINAFDKYGFTAMHYAARFNRFTMMAKLVNEGAKIAVRTHDGLLPLHYAARHVPVLHDEDVEGEDEAAIEGPQTSSKRIMMLLLREHQKRKITVNIPERYGATALHLACSRGNEDGVSLLLESEGIEVNIQDKQQDTPLHSACLNGSVTIVEMLLNHGANALIANEEGVLPIHVACQEGNVAIVRTIMRLRFNERSEMLTRYDNEQNYALHLACKSGVPELVQILFLQQADPTVRKIHNITPLHIVARDGFRDVAEILLKSKQIEINCVNDKSETPLHLAAKKNQVEMIQFLLSSGAEIEALDDYSYTPIMTAIAHGNKEAMDELISRGANVDRIDRDGQSIVFIAADHNRLSVLKALILGSHYHIGARLASLTNDTHNTPLHIAAYKGFLEAVKILLRAEGVQPGALNEKEETPAHLAAFRGHTEVVRELIRVKKGIVNSEDDESNTPLHLACSHGHVETARVLLQAGADPNARNAIYWTPIDAAASGGWDRTVQLLIEHESDLDPKDKANVTPLHLACKEGHVKVVKTLLDNNANVSSVTKSQQNCLDIAIEAGHKDVCLVIIRSNQWKDALRNMTLLPMGGFTTPLRRLIRRMPDVAKEVFDRCADTNEGERLNREGERLTRESEDFLITLDYEFLEDFEYHPPGKLKRVHSWKRKAVNGVASSAEEKKFLVTRVAADEFGEEEELVALIQEDKSRRVEHWGPQNFEKDSHCLNIMVSSNRTELLKHPLVTSLLNYKWTKFGQLVYFSNLAVYFVFLISLVVLALVLVPPSSNFCQEARTSNETNCGLEVDREYLSPSESGVLIIAALIVIVFAIIKICSELFQLWQMKLLYFLDWVNYLEWILFVSSIIFAFIFTSPCFCLPNWQWQVGAIAVFLSWIDLIIFFRKFPITGIYIVMFMDIFYIFWRMIILALMLVMAFALSFYMLFHNPQLALEEPALRTPFVSVGRSIVKTMTMTTGEFEYDTIFRQCQDDACEEELTYVVASFTLWVIFLILMPILFTNLLVGLAVDDIKGTLETAVLKRLALRVELVLTVEQRIPSFIRKRVVTGQRTLQPNRKLNIFERFWYNTLGIFRFDSIENIFSALEPEPEPIERVQEQNQQLESRVQMLARAVDNLQHQNSRLLQICSALADNSGIRPDSRGAADDMGHFEIPS